MNLLINRGVLPAALVAAFVFAGANFSARAQESKDDVDFQQRLFGRALDGGQIHACFSRVYDAAHLAQHPRQNVRTMLLLVKANSDSDQPRYELRLGVTFRRSGAHFDSAGDCGSIHDTSDVGGSAGAAHCGVDCDGGSIDVAIKDQKSVLVSIPYGARIWRAGSDNDSDQAKRFGADDKVFRLDKAALTECLRLADDSKEKASMRRGQ
jgi:hypothetical protein